jgi:hypothetical protein
MTPNPLHMLLKDLLSKGLQHYERKTGLTGVSDLITPMVHEEIAKLNIPLDVEGIKMGLGAIELIRQFNRQQAMPVIDIKDANNGSSNT